MTDRFKKCPCCGGDVAVIAAAAVKDMELRARATVRCTDCQLTMTRTGITRDEALYALETSWNQRVAEPVRKGHWIDGADQFGGKRGTFRVCSFCNICIPIDKAVPERYWQSCPNCRTVMEEGRKEE